MTHAERIRTGGQSTRQACQMLDLRNRGLFGTLGTFSDDLTAGGPIDAPREMPAGSTSNNIWRSGPWTANNGQGVPCVEITTTHRAD